MRTALAKNAPRALLLLTLLIIGCGQTSRDWKEAEAANTAEACTDFVAKHPQDSHSVEARARIDSLEWSSAKAQNTVADYKAYLERHAQGLHASDAMNALDDLAWGTARPKGGISGFNDYTSNPANTRHRAEAEAALEAAVVDLFAPGQPVAKQPFTVIGLVHYTPGRHDEYNAYEASATLEVKGHTFDIVMDPIGRKMGIEMNGKRAQVRGTLTGRSYTEMTMALTSVATGSVTESKYLIELKVNAYMLSQDGQLAPRPGPATDK